MWEERIEDRKKKRKEWRNKNPDDLDDQVCDINLFESWKERSNCGTNKGGVRLYIYIYFRTLDLRIIRMQLIF